MDLIQPLTQLIKTSPFVAGGLSVGLISFVGNSLRTLPHKLLERLENFLFMSVQVNVGSDLYRRIEQYFENKKIPIKHGIAWLSTENLDLKWSPSDGNSTETDWERFEKLKTESSKKKQRVKITTYDGPVKSMLFKHSWVRIKKERPKDEGGAGTGFVGALLASTKPEHYLFQFLTFDRSLPKRFLETIVDATHVDKDNFVPIYLNNENSWSWLFDLPKRSMESVVTDKQLHHELLKHVQDFLNHKDWYLELGIPYHFGCLLYGPPGSGKTSILHAIASTLNLAIYFLDVSIVKDNTDLVKLLSKLEESGIIIFEDIDNAFLTKHDDKHKLTLSGLLNCLDGIKSTPGLLIAMTTNHLEKLEQALIRAGRIDYLYHIDNASLGQVKQLFLKFYGEDQLDLAERFTLKMPDKKLSMAELQGYFLQHQTAEDALHHKKDLLQVIKHVGT